MSKKSIYKKCPRCGEKCYNIEKVCDNCKLVFARLEYASNKKAKEAIKKGAKEQVITTNVLPKDVNKWKLLLICGFGGLFGAHNFYVGRYFKAIFSCFFMFLTFVLIAFFNNELVTMLFTNYLFLPAGLVFYFWFYDMLMIGISKYKVPIALDIPKKEEEYEKK